MPSVPPTLLNRGLHFCASCCGTLVCWAIWIFLGVLLFALSSVALLRELPVPDFVLRRTEAQLTQSGLILQFGRARFDPTGKILLEDVKVRTRGFEDPLLVCRLIYMRHDIWSMLSGWTVPDEIKIEGAALQLPAMLSPSGTTEPIIKNLGLTLRHENKVWHVEQFAGHLGPMSLSVSGALTGRTATTGGLKLSLDAITQRYLQTARRVAPVMIRLNAFENPSLFVRLSVTPATGNLAELLFTADKVYHPWDQPVVIGPVVAGTQLSLEAQGLRPVQVQVATRALAYGDTVRAQQVRAVLQTELSLENFSGQARELFLAAGAIEYTGEHVLGPVVRADLSRWPVVQSTAAAQIDGEILSASVEASLTDKSARLHADGRVAADLINRVMPRHFPRAAKYFVFGDPLRFEADAVFAPGWKFERLSSRTEIGRLDSSGVNITSARGQIDIVGTRFLAHDARIEMGENLARGSYWMDFANTDYRMLLEGRLRPLEINGWFRTDWWSNLWSKYFDFPVAPIAAEVDMQGRWREPLRSHSFIRGSVRSAIVWGGDFEHGDATLFIRPNFLHGWNLHGTRAGGTQKLTGTFKRFVVPETRETARLEFDFITNAETTFLGRLLEGRADDVLSTLRFAQPPQFHAWGAINGTVPDYQFTGEAQGGLHYYGFPLDTVQAKGSVRGQEVNLHEVKFTTAGGHGSGRATLSGAPNARRLGFDAFLNEAKLGRTVRAVQEYDAYRLGKPFVPSPEAKFVQQAVNSNVDFALSGQGDPNSLASFKGTGNAALTGAKLGEIHLFGLLSQVLSGLSLSFSSLKLDAIRSSVELDNGALYFPDLKVTGPSSVIDAKGYYTFETNALDFRARFKPYDQPGSLLAAAASLILNPLTSILELKLTGPLDDPKWSVLLGSSAAPKAPAAPPTAESPAPLLPAPLPDQ